MNREGSKIRGVSRRRAGREAASAWGLALLTAAAVLAYLHGHWDLLAGPFQLILEGLP